MLNVYAGDSFLASATLACSNPEDPGISSLPADAIAQAQIPYDVHIFGNHEFDYGPDFLQRFIFGFVGETGVEQPFLSANLDFSAEPGWSAWIDEDGIVETPVTDSRIVGRSAIVTDEVSGERFGVVGATTPQLPVISSPRDVTVTPDLATTAAAVQAEIDALTAQGVDRIILVSHLQDVDNDKELVAQLSGVDIAVAGGGDELLANDPAELLPGDDPEGIEGTYPIVETDAAGRDVLIVTTAGNYRYLGRLDVTFGSDGEIAEVLADSSGPRRVIPAEQDGDQIAALGIEDAVESDAEMVTTVVDGVTACLDTFASTPVATSDVILNVARGATDPFILGVRSAETNGGNIVSDAFTAAYDAYAASTDLPERGPDALVVTIQNGGGIRQNAGDVLPQGAVEGAAITRLDTLNVLPFDNTVVVVEGLSATDLRDTLELSCASVGGGGFLQVSALRYTCDLTAEPGSQARDVVVLGPDPGPEDDVTVVDAEGVVDESVGPIAVVTNSFTAGGGDGFEVLGAHPATRLIDTEGGTVFYERALREYLESFPAGPEGIAHVPADDARYSAETGEGRITIVAAAAAPEASPAG